MPFRWNVHLVEFQVSLPRKRRFIEWYTMSKAHFLRNGNLMNGTFCRNQKHEPYSREYSVPFCGCVNDIGCVHSKIQVCSVLRFVGGKYNQVRFSFLIQSNFNAFDEPIIDKVSVYQK